MLRVFVSSRMQELAAERAAVATTLREMGVDAFVFEDDAGARPGTIVDTYREELVASDVYLGLFWLGFGDYTNDEYRVAAAAGLPRLVYERPPGEEDRRDPELASFLERIGHVEDGDLTIAWFDDATQLAEDVRRDIDRLRTDAVRRQVRSGAYVAKTGPLGARLEADELPVIKVRRPHLAGCAPPPDPFLGRERPLEKLRTALARGERIVGMRGEPGLGKSALVARLVADLGADFPDGAVCVQAADHVARRDVLRDIWTRYLDAGVPNYVPTDADLAEGIGGREALVTVDDVAIPASDVEQLAAAMPRSAFVVTGAPAADDSLDPLAYVKAVNLGGFTADDDIVALFEDDYGEPVPDEARGHVVAACRAVGAGPGQIRRLANDAWDSDAPLTEWAQEAAGPPAAEDARAVRLVGAAGAQTAMPTPVAEALGISAEQLAVLQAAGLLKAASPRFRLAAPSPTDVAAAVPEDVAQVVAATARWVQTAPAAAIAESRAFVGWVTAEAAAIGRHETVVDLARATSDALAAHGWWGAWGQVLELARSSAATTGDDAAAGWALHQLGTRAEVLTGPGAGAALLRQAAALRLAAGDLDGAALTRHNIEQIEAFAPRSPDGDSGSEQESVSDQDGSPQPQQRKQQHTSAETVQLPVTERITEQVPTVDPVDGSGGVGDIGGAGGKRWWQRGWVWGVAVGVAAVGAGAVAATTLLGDDGTGALGVEPAALSFGDVPFGAAAPARTVTFTNGGDGALDVIGVRLDGDGASQFTVVGDCAGRIAQGDACALDVTFTPATPGAHGAQIIVETAEDTASVSLDGRATIGMLAVEPDRVEFGALPVGTSGEVRRVRVANDGDAPLEPLSIVLAQDAATAAPIEPDAEPEPAGEPDEEAAAAGEPDARLPFALDASDCAGRTLGAGDACDVMVGFTPPTSGSFAADLLVTSGETTISVVATGIGAFGELVPDPATVEFGEVELSTAVRDQLLLTNEGDVPLTIDSVVVDGDDAVTIESACDGRSLAPSESCRLEVRYLPVDRGPVTAAIVATTDSGATRVAVTGQGIAGEFAIDAESLDFGDVPIGDSQDRSVVVANRGRGRLAFTSAIDPPSDQFVASGCEGVTLGPGDSCTITITFVPTIAGPTDATFEYSFRVAQGGGSGSVGLTGTGVTDEVVVSGDGVGPLAFGDPDAGLADLIEALGAPDPEVVEWDAVSNPDNCLAAGFAAFASGLELRFTDGDSGFASPGTTHFAQWIARDGSPPSPSGLRPVDDTLATVEAALIETGASGDTEFQDGVGLFVTVTDGPDAGIRFYFEGTEPSDVGDATPLTAMFGGAELCDPDLVS